MEYTRRSPKPAKSRAHARKHADDDVQGPPSEYLWVGSIGGWVTPSLFLEKPLVAQLVGEDACWRIAVAAWRGRRPSRWRVRARSAWRCEMSVLLEKKTRLIDQALGLGIRPVVGFPVAGRKAR